MGSHQFPESTRWIETTMRDDEKSIRPYPRIPKAILIIADRTIRVIARRSCSSIRVHSYFPVLCLLLSIHPVLCRVPFFFNLSFQSFASFS